MLGARRWEGPELTVKRLILHARHTGSSRNTILQFELPLGLLLLLLSHTLQKELAPYVAGAHL